MSRYRREKWKRQEEFQTQKPAGGNVENFHANVTSTNGVKFLFTYLGLKRVHKPVPVNGPPPRSDISGANVPDRSIQHDDPSDQSPGGLFDG